MRNAALSAAAEVLNAIGALRLKRHTLRTTAEGVEIAQPGRPTLLLTYEAARQFAAEMNEADA